MKQLKKGLPIAVIIVSAVICCVCVFTDVGDKLGGFAKSLVLGSLGIDGTKEESGTAPNYATAANTDLGALDKAELVRVVDGDTFLLNLNGTETKVRLIGVDTPESVAPSTYYKENTEEGKTVSEIVKEKMSSTPFLYVEYDVAKTDKYGRTLAYLYFSDGVMVQEWLLKNGYANVATYAPNIKYSERFVALAHNAMENKIGLWNGFFSDD